MTTAEQDTRQGQGRRMRRRRGLSIDAAVRVLARAGFEVHRFAATGDVAAYHRSEGLRLTVLLTPHRGRLYVIVQQTVAGRLSWPVFEDGQRVGTLWRWHDIASATRRGLSLAHQQQRCGAVCGG